MIKKNTQKENEMVAAPCIHLAIIAAARICDSRWRNNLDDYWKQPRRPKHSSSSSSAIRRRGWCPQIMYWVFSRSSDTQPFPWDIRIIASYSWHMPTCIGWFLQLYFPKNYSSFMNIFSIYNLSFKSQF